MYSNGPYTELARGKENIAIIITQQLENKLEEKEVLKLQSMVHNAMESNVMIETLLAENLCVQIKYNIIEADCDLLPYLINIGSLALTSAGILQKSLITATSIVSII